MWFYNLIDFILAILNILIIFHIQETNESLLKIYCNRLAVKYTLCCCPSCISHVLSICLWFWLSLIGRLLCISHISIFANKEIATLLIYINTCILVRKTPYKTVNTLGLFPTPMWQICPPQKGTFANRMRVVLSPHFVKRCVFYQLYQACISYLTQNTKNTPISEDQSAN